MDTLYGWLGLESQFLAGTRAFHLLGCACANLGQRWIHYGRFFSRHADNPAELYEAAAVDEVEVGASSKTSLGPN